MIGAGVQFPTQLQAAASSNSRIRYFSEKVNINVLKQTEQKGAELVTMELTMAQIEDLMLLLIMMGVKKQEVLEIATAIETRERLLWFLQILSERDYKMTPEEVYEAACDTLEKFQLEEAGLL